MPDYEKNNKSHGRPSKSYVYRILQEQNYE